MTTSPTGTPAALDVPALLRNHLDEQVVLVCRSGQRVGQAGQALAGAGLPNLRVLTGGIIAWAARAPVTTGTPRWAWTGRSASSRAASSCLQCSPAPSQIR